MTGRTPAFDAIVYCDGSGLATPGPAGIAYVATVGEATVEKSLEVQRATNQQAEVLAAALALHELEPQRVLVWSDSEYVVKGVNERIAAAIARGWRTTGGRTWANRKHWERLLEARDRHPFVEFRWCRGHNGTEGNERADELAGAARIRVRDGGA